GVGGDGGGWDAGVVVGTTAKIVLGAGMNPRMWANRATQRNLTQLVADGVVLVGPDEGEMAEPGERGLGRMAEPSEIALAAEKLLAAKSTQLLQGRRVLITSGPTHEAID